MNYSKRLEEEIECYDQDSDIQTTGGEQGMRLADKMIQEQKRNKKISRRTEEKDYKVTIPLLNEFEYLSGTHETRATTKPRAVTNIAFRVYEGKPNRARKALAHLKRNYGTLEQFAEEQ